MGLLARVEDWRAVDLDVEAPAEDEVGEDRVGGRPEIRGIFSLITMQMGEQVMVAVQAEMDFSQRGSDLVKQINVVEKGLKKEFPQVAWVFFEPDDSD